MGIKLNLGCGFHKLDGYVNIDMVPDCAPDMVLDIEGTWPFEDGTVDEIVAHHILEHMHYFIQVAQEMYRVLRIGGTVDVKVPHPRSDAFLADPTHVRPVLPMTLMMFSKRVIAKTKVQGYTTTALADYCNVDLEVKDIQYGLNPYWQDKLDKGEIVADDVMQLMATHNNVCEEISMIWEKAS